MTDDNGPERVMYDATIWASGNRFSIPRVLARDDGIEEGERYDMHVILSDGTEFRLPDKLVGRDFYVAIEGHLVDRYGVEPHESIDVIVEIPQDD